MKKLFVKLLLTSILMVFMVAPLAMADQVIVWHNSFVWSAAAGGEFGLQIKENIPDIPDLNPILSSYADTTKNQHYTPSFQSFCVETKEFVESGNTYNVTISDHSIFSNKPLSIGAAWLYREFQLGILPGYDFTNTGVGRFTTALALQETIWWLMGVGDEPSNTNIFRNAVLHQPFGDPLAPNNGTYPVFVLNLWNPGGFDVDHRAQDMLVGGVPEPATMLLFGSGLIGLAGLVRRRFKK